MTLGLLLLLAKLFLQNECKLTMTLFLKCLILSVYLLDVKGWKLISVTCRQFSYQAKRWNYQIVKRFGIYDLNDQQCGPKIIFSLSFFITISGDSQADLWFLQSHPLLYRILNPIPKLNLLVKFVGLAWVSNMLANVTEQENLPENVFYGEWRCSHRNMGF